MSGERMSYTSLVNNVWHVVRGTGGRDQLKKLLDWQRTYGGLKSSKVLILQNQPSATRYILKPERKSSILPPPVPVPIPVPSDYPPDPDSSTVSKKPSRKKIKLPPAPFRVIEGDFSVEGHAARYSAFSNFGEVFWQNIAHQLELGPEDVLQFHSLSAGLVMAGNRGSLQDLSTGVVLTPPYEPDSQVRAFINYILRHEQSGSPAWKIYSEYLSALERGGTISFPLDSGFVHQSLPTVVDDIDELTAVYLQSIYGTGYQYSYNLTRSALAHGPVVDQLIILTAEKEGEVPKVKRDFIIRSITDDPILGKLYRPEGIIVIGLSDTPAAEGELDIIPWDGMIENGPAYHTMIKRALSTPGVEGLCTVVMSEAGTNTRSPNGEDNKASTFTGESNQRNTALTSLIHAIVQSPERGKGSIFMAGIDNEVAGSGPLMSGRRLYFHSLYRMELFQKEHVVNLKNPASAKDLEDRGTSVADVQAGRILSMKEKEPAGILFERLGHFRTNIAFENTMIQRLTVGAGQKFMGVLDLPSHAAPGKSLIQHYRLIDLSRDIVSPQTFATYQEGAIYVEKLRKRCEDHGILFSPDDANSIINHVRNISGSRGLGLVEIEFFSDSGDFAAYTRLHELMLDPIAGDLRTCLRYFSGMDPYENNFLDPQTINLMTTKRNYREDKVNILGDPNTIYIGKGVKVAPGTIIQPFTMIAHQTQMTVPMKLKKNTIITGAKINDPITFSSADNPTHTNPWRIIYNLTVHPGYDLALPNDGAMFGFRLPDRVNPRSGKVIKKEQIAFFPISTSLRRDEDVIGPNGEVVKDPVLGYYPLVKNISAKILAMGTEYSWVKFMADVIPYRETLGA